MRIPQILLKPIQIFYNYIFKEKMSNEVEYLLANVVYVALGTIPNVILTFIFYIIAGRILGPTEYGSFVLIQSVAMFLYIPMLLGFNTAMIKYISEKENFNRQSKIISTMYILVFLFVIISICLYLIGSLWLSSLFSIPPDLFHLSIVFAVLFVFFTITTSTLRSLFQMKKFALAQIIYSLILLGSFFFFMVVHIFSFKSMIYSIFFAYGISGLIVFLFFTRKYVHFQFDRSWAVTLTKYASFSLLGGISSIFYTNTDKILINKFMTVKDVGVYGVYNITTITLVTLFSSIFITVFFPFASRCKDKGVIFQKINKIIPYILLFIPVIVIIQFLILKLYGSQYPFDLTLSVLFGIGGLCICIDALYGWLMNSVGKRGVKITSIAAIGLAITNIFLNFLLIPRIGFQGAAIALIFSYLVSIFIVLLKRKNYFITNVEA